MTRPLPNVKGVLGAARRFHFVGVGGIGMSGIAELLVNLGYGVSGSDIKRSEITDRLVSLGVRVEEGHDARHLRDAEIVVYSSAVKDTNPEIAAARSRGIPIVPRAELLAELMQLRYGIAVAGAHGKTTTTSMIAVVLEGAGLDPTAVIGGRLSAFGSNARLGGGNYLVAEADESDRSFLRLAPQLAVVTNIDYEHLDAYRDFSDLEAAFVQFANRVPRDGTVVLCADDERLEALRPGIERRMVTYGLTGAPDFKAVNVRLEGFGSVSEVTQRQTTGSRVVLGNLRLSVPGHHNVQNALAAVAVGRELGIGWSDIARTLEGFSGVERRFQRRGEVNGITVVDDYGHHPTEIAAVIAAARPIACNRLVVVFQPHRYSRTKQLMTSFGPAFSGADAVLLTDIYPAGEDAVPGVTVETLAQAVRGSFSAPLHVVRALDDVPRHVARVARPGDLVVLLGAGSIGSIWRKVLDELEKGRGA